MTLIKTSLLNGIAVFIRIMTLLGINKLLAFYVGPIGYAVLGQFQNAMTIITTFASGAINTGVTKYTAEYFDDEPRQRTVWRTAGSIALAGSIIASLIIIFFREALAVWFLNDAIYAHVFLWFAGSLVFFVFNALLLAILNGKKEIAKYVMANIFGSLTALLITIILATQYGLHGALVALAIFQSISFIMTLLICMKSKWFRFSYILGGFDIQIIKNLSQYTFMALTTALCVPISHIFVREYLGNQFGWESAGYWEAMWRISAAYLMLITTTLSVYYLPRISELNCITSLKQEVYHCYKVILPFGIACSIFIYLFKDQLIVLLFTEAFLPMRELFAWQIIGDTFKIGSWLLAYLMLGKSMTKHFVMTEIIFSINFYLLVVICTKISGFYGVSVAYATNYLLYWITMYFIVFRNLQYRFAK